MLGLQSSLAKPVPGGAPLRGLPPVGANALPAAGGPCLSSRPEPRKQACRLSSDFLPPLCVSAPAPWRRSCGRGGSLATAFASDAGQLKQAKEDIKQLLVEKKPHGIMIRLGWHDAGSYDKNITEWPKCGGANGSLRFSLELGHSANAGLIKALKLVLPIKDKYPDISHADLFQLASVTAIEDAGGPKVPMKYGRVDTGSETECAIEGNLPDGDPPVPSDHLRKVFYRMGFNDNEIVALSGAHTIGRSRPERSGFGKAETKYTTRDNMGSPGGQSWTVEWLTFDNSYFKDIKAQKDEDLLVLPTDKVLTEDPEFQKYANKYAEDQDAFFQDYAEAHAKLSELGAKWDPPEGFKLDDAPTVAPVAEKFVAATFSSGSDQESSQRELSETMKQKIRAEYLAIGGSPDKPLTSNYFLNIMIVVAVLAIISSIITQN